MNKVAMIKTDGLYYTDHNNAIAKIISQSGVTFLSMNTMIVKGEIITYIVYRERS